MTTTESTSATVEQLVAEVDERLDATRPEEWGEEIDVAEWEKFLGRYLSEEIDPENDKKVFLLLAPVPGVSDLAASSVPCFIRERSVLRSEMDRARPRRGDIIVIGRGKDKPNKDPEKNDIHMYRVAVGSCHEPLPEGAAKSSDDEIG